MGSTFGIDVRIGADNLQAEAAPVEESLRKIDDKGKGATRSLKRGFDDAASSARSLKREVDSLDSLVERATKGIKGANKGWDEFRRGADKAVGRSSQSEIDQLTKLTNEMTAGIVDSTESTKGLGKAIKKTGDDGEISLERIIKGQIRLNAANIKTAGSFLLMGSFASRAMGLIQEKVEEGYKQIGRLGAAIGGAVISGQGLGFDGLNALERRKAILEESIRQGRGGEKSTFQKAAGFGAGFLGHDLDKQREQQLGTLKDQEYELSKIRRHEAAVAELARHGASAAEVELAYTQSSAVVREKLVELRRREADNIRSGLDALEQLHKFSADEEERVRAEWKAEQSRLESVVASVDRQYAAQQRLKALEEDLGDAVRSRIISLDHAVELMNEQRRLAQDDLHPTWKMISDVASRVNDTVGKITPTMWKAVEAGQRFSDALAEANRKAAETQSEIRTFLAIDPGDLKAQKDEDAKAAQELLERRTLGGGARAGLRDLKHEFMDLGEVMRNSIVDAAHLGEQALVDMFTTGKFEAGQFLDDLMRIAVQLSLRSLIGGGLTAAGAANGADFLVPGMANGGSGTMRARNSSDQVPVFFMAQHGERVIVETHQQQQRSPYSPANGAAPAVTIINQQDPRAQLGVINTPEGGRVVANQVHARREFLRRTLR